MLVAFPVSLAAAICPVRSFPAETGDYSKKSNLQQLAVLSELQGKIRPADFRIDFVDVGASQFSWGMNAATLATRVFMTGSPRSHTIGFALACNADHIVCVKSWETVT